MENLQSKEEKRPSPHETANFFSKLIFSWVLDFIRSNLKARIQTSDLHAPVDSFKAKSNGIILERNWLQELEKSKVLNRDPKLYRALLKTFWKMVVFQGLGITFSFVVIKGLQPVFLGLILSYFSPGNTEEPYHLYLYLAALIISVLLGTLFLHQSYFVIYASALKIRASCSYLVYQKILRLKKSSLGGKTIGNIMSILTTDLERLEIVCRHIESVWTTTILIILITYLTYTFYGVPAIVGMVIYLLSTLIQCSLSLLGRKIRKKAVQIADERIKTTSEVISGMQVIKMYAWEHVLMKLISGLRRKEESFVRKSHHIHAIVEFLRAIILKLVLFCILSTIIYMDMRISVFSVFVLTSIYELLRIPLENLSFVLIFFPEMKVTVNRMEKFLLQSEMVKLTYDASEIRNMEKSEISMESVYASWNGCFKETILMNINLTVQPGQLLLVVGRVGSGKTSLLHLILGELPAYKGVLKVSGDISYATQEPWLFPATIRQNILFGQDYDLERYAMVTSCCILEQDFASLPHGDMTLVGEKGIVLSGGQKARINLARCIYRQADIYLLDDPLSAVDSHVSRQLFEKCISGILKQKTCILVTHQLQYLSQADSVCIMDNGNIVTSGNYKELLEQGLNFSSILGISNDLAENLSSEYDDETISFGEKSKEDSVDDLRATGCIKMEVYLKYFKLGGNLLVIFTVLMVIVSTGILTGAVDLWLAVWSQAETYQWEVANGYNISIQQSNLGLYIPSKNFHIPSRTSVSIYGGLIALLILFNMVYTFSIYGMSMRASKELHDNMLFAVTNSVLKFFHQNPAGRIITRFSMDLGVTDEMVPLYYILTTQCALVVGVTFFIMSVLQYWAIGAGILIILFCFGAWKFYVPAIQDIKRLDSISKSSVLSHVTSSIHGLSTIRASNMEESLMQEMENKLDQNTSAGYILYAVARSFGLAIDMGGMLYFSGVTLGVIYSVNGISSIIGLTINQCLGIICNLQWGLRQMIEEQTYMTAVERILQFTEIEQEPSHNRNNHPPNGWPMNGLIVFKDVSLCYDKNHLPVLKQLNFSIFPGEKIGIVGRTGAGKTSLINALLRLALVEGEISIDGINTGDISLQDLRRNMSVIPQDPVLLSGTLRFNLDPIGEFPDHRIWKALQEVRLAEQIGNGEEALNVPVEALGNNFSVGQRQLICLARAILKDCRVILLDEATSNVDLRSDKLIQETIRKKFSSCTVLTIAHRLQTVIDADRIIVMDAGTMVEFDHPYVLLQHNNGYFYRLVERCGERVSKELHKSAEEAYLHCQMQILDQVTTHL